VPYAIATNSASVVDLATDACFFESHEIVTGLFLSNKNTIEPAIDLLALVLIEASRDR